jgi:3-methyladenine DNA glycosylase AlkD
VTDRASFVAEELSALADPGKAAGMAAYMKTDMPFYGVQKPARSVVLRAMIERFPVESREEYEEAVLDLWALPHREEKYLAIGLATHHGRFVTPSSMPLYRRLIVEGAWWDFVDEVAVRLVGRVLRDHRRQLTAPIRTWAADADMWIRRAAIISQVGHKEQTDPVLLFELCETCAHEREFFIRKAIGWALREYAKTAPDTVREFALAHRAELSGLSFREATKHLAVS